MLFFVQKSTLGMVTVEAYDSVIIGIHKKWPQSLNSVRSINTSNEPPKCNSSLPNIYWWLIELPFWFKGGFLLKVLGILTTQYEKDILWLRIHSSTKQSDFQPMLEKFLRASSIHDHKQFIL